MAKLTVSQQEYEKLRSSGLSKEQIISKYSEKPKSFGEKVNSVAQGITKFVGAEGISEQYGASLARTQLKAQGNTQAANLVENPSLRRVVGSAIQTGANFIPGAGVGASLARKAAVGAATGYAFDVGQNLQLGRKGTDAFKPGIGSVVGGSLPVLGKIIGLTSKNLPAAMSKKLEETSLRLTPTERQNLERKGQDIAKYLSQKRIVGTPGQRYAKVSSLYDDVERRVQTEVSKARFAYPKGKLVQELQDIPNAFIDDPELANEAQNTIGRFVTSLQTQRGDMLSGNAINELKRNYMKRAFSKNTADVISESRLAIAAQLNKILRENVPGLEAINKEYGYIIASRRALHKAVSRPQIGLTGKLIGIGAGGAIGAGLGGGLGSAVGMSIGPTIGKTIAGTLPRSAVGAGLQTISNLSQRIQNLPTDGLGNISQKAVLNLLESLKQ